MPRGSGYGAARLIEALAGPRWAPPVLLAVLIGCVLGAAVGATLFEWRHNSAAGYVFLAASALGGMAEMRIRHATTGADG